VRLALVSHVVVGSIGPTTSGALRARGLPVGFEPESACARFASLERTTR
jgi:hypothetical protein